MGKSKNHPTEWGVPIATFDDTGTYSCINCETVGLITESSVLVLDSSVLTGELSKWDHQTQRDSKYVRIDE